MSQDRKSMQGASHHSSSSSGGTAATGTGHYSLPPLPPIPMPLAVIPETARLPQIIMPALPPIPIPMPSIDALVASNQALAGQSKDSATPKKNTVKTKASPTATTPRPQKKQRRSTTPSPIAAAAAASEERSTTPTSLLNRETFLTLCEENKTASAEEILLKLGRRKTLNSTQKPLTFTVEMPNAVEAKSGQLALHFSISLFTFKKRPQLKMGDFFSWVFKEADFLKLHQCDEKAYTKPNYLIEVKEKKNGYIDKKAISQTWISHTLKFAEMRNIKKGKYLSGTEIMKIYDDFIDPIFKAETVYLWDSSRISEAAELDPQQVLFRTSRAIAYGCNWYKNFGFIPFDIYKLKSAWPSDYQAEVELEQNVAAYYAAIYFLQNFPLRDLKKILLLEQAKVLNDTKEVADTRIAILDELCLKYLKVSLEMSQENPATLFSLVKAIHSKPRISGDPNADHDLSRMFSLLRIRKIIDHPFYQHLLVLDNTTIFLRSRTMWLREKQAATAAHHPSMLPTSIANTHTVTLFSPASAASASQEDVKMEKKRNTSFIKK